MSYRGKSVNLEEMLGILNSHERTEAAAALELEHALEDKKIELWAPDGTGPDGQLWRKLPEEETSAIIAMLRDYANRAPIPPIRSWNLPIAMFKAARASRMQFEIACDLAEQPTEPEKVRPKGPVPGSINRYGESDRARFSEIEELMKSGKTLTAACTELGPSLDGPGTPDSKATRLRKFFQSMKTAH